MTELSDMIAAFNATASRIPKRDAETMVASRLTSAGHLAAGDVSFLIERTGWSRASIFRMADGVDLPGPDLPDDATFFDRIQVCGSSGFVFDDLALGMLAAHGGNMARFRRDVKEYETSTGLILPMPSEAQLSRRFRNEVRQQIRDGVKTGHRNRYKSTLRGRWEAEYVNQICQLDEFILNQACLTFATDRESDFIDDNGDPLDPVKVVVGHDERWMVPVRVRVLALEEAKSRFAWWAGLDRPPKAEDTLGLLADKIDVRAAENGAKDVMIGGAFDVLSTDNAGCFRAHVVGAAMELSSGGSLDINVGYDPVGKGKVERLGQTIENNVVHGLQGHLSRMESRSGKDMLAVPTHMLLPFDDVVDVIRRVMYTYNYETVHSSVGSTPVDAFHQGCPNPQRVDDSVIGDMMMPAPRSNGMRKVLNDGLQVFGRRGYLAPELARADVYNDQVKVQARTFHHRTDKIAVFKPLERRTDPDAVEFVAMAEDFSLISKQKRKELMRIWQVDGATVTRSSKTAARLKDIARDSGQAGPVNLTEAALLDQDRTRNPVPEADAASTDSEPDPVEPPAEPDGETPDAETAPPKEKAKKKAKAPQKADSGRRPHTTSRPKPVPAEQRSPATGPGTAELDMIEAALAQSLQPPASTEDVSDPDETDQ